MGLRALGRLPLLSLAFLAAGIGCRGKQEQRVRIETVPVARRTIVAEVTASGSVEPINIVDVRSKASGQIIDMPVETGSMVKPGDLLVQLDTKDVQSQFDQAQADLNAAQAKLAVSEAQKKRSDEMYKQQVITAQENETASLDLANSQASVTRAQASLDQAQTRLNDATVRAPVAGTVIVKTVSLGQVIASATSSASGGTSLLQMADLTKVRVRALFNETDIGNVNAGQDATVTVDAYPDRPFRGVVEKIEPQAVVQQSVTMFPVLVTLANQDGALKPGMNGEVSVLVDRREDVLSVPNDAVRTTREAAATARMIGLDADSVTASVQEQMRSLGGGMGGGMGGGRGGRGGRNGGRRSAQQSGGEVALAPVADDAQGTQGRSGRQGMQLPQVSDQDCAKVTDALSKKPQAQQILQGLRGRVQAGEIDQQQSRAISDSMYKALGVDAGVARACQFRGRGGRQGGGSSPSGGRSGNAGSAQAPTATDAPVQAGEFPMRQRTRAALVYVRTDSGHYAPRVIRAGMSDLDYTEVTAGLQEGEQVVLMSALAMQAARDSALARMRGRSSGGVPGMQRNSQGGTNLPGGGGGRGRGR